MQPELYFWECCYPRQYPRSGVVPGEHPAAWVGCGRVARVGSYPGECTGSTGSDRGKGSKAEEPISRSCLLLRGGTSHQTPGLASRLLLSTLPDIPGVARDWPRALRGAANPLLRSRVPVAIFFQLPPPPPPLGCRGLQWGCRQSRHGLCSPQRTEMLQVPFLVKSLCLESAAERSPLAPAAPLLELNAVELPGWCAKKLLIAVSQGPAARTLAQDPAQHRFYPERAACPPCPIRPLSHEGWWQHRSFVLFKYDI